MTKIKELIKQIFGFSETESKGFVVLMVIVLIAVILPSVGDQYLLQNKNNRDKDIAMFNSMISQLEEEQAIKYPKKEVAFKNIERPKIILKSFDPNKADIEEMKSLGMPSFLAKRIDKYRDKGGRFKKKQDLKKIYGFPEKLYSKLEPYIQIKATKQFEKTSKNEESDPSSKKTEKLTSFDINLADTTQLKKINGIGSILSARIVKFRDKLGGFHSINQLKEVYGLKPGVQERLIGLSFIATDFEVKKVKINSTTAYQLMSHPYIGKKTAWSIVNYRDKNGMFSKVTDLENIDNMEKELIQKIAPYLDFTLD